MDKLSEQNASLLSDQIKNTVNSGLQRFTLSKQWTEANNIKIRPFLLNKLSHYTEIEQFAFLNTNKQVLFSLYPNNSPNSDLTETISDSLQRNALRNAIFRLANSDNYAAFWLLPFNKEVHCVVLINPTVRIRDIIHSFRIKFYLLGFGGLLAVIVLALIWSRVLNSPMKNIEKAMTYIDKRKYGFRLKKKKDDQFATIYEKVNLALQRLEQLDTVQRNAVQHRNALLKEMKTISRFMDMMAHEVKNPLHALGINLDVLKTKVEKGKRKEEILKHSEILDHEIAHLQGVIQGFLSYVRPGVPRRERTKINKIIKDVCEMVATEAEKSKIRIESRLGKALDDVLVDRGQLQQAIHNLLLNAVHATGQGGKVNIRSWGKRKKVMLSIKDTGTGISKEQLKQIFDLYFTTKKNGTGLGLPISKRIIEANGGQLQLESKLDKGTTVTISLQTV